MVTTKTDSASPAVGNVEENVAVGTAVLNAYTVEKTDVYMTAVTKTD